MWRLEGLHTSQVYHVFQAPYRRRPPFIVSPYLFFLNPNGSVVNLAAIIELYEQGAIKPHIARTYRFDEAAAAHQFIHDRKATGKVLLIP